MVEKNPAKELVEKYLQWGFNVLPAKDGTKYPVTKWEKYQKEKYPQGEIEKYLNQGKENYLVVCGSISGNLVVLDFDDPQIYEEYRRKMETELLDTFTVKTGKKGYHVYYRTPKVVNSTKMGEVDILGEGKLAVLPPSIHPETGRRYEIVKDLEPLKMGKREWDHILSVLREITGQRQETTEMGKLKDNMVKIIKTIIPYWREGRRDTLEYALLGYMRKKDVPKNIARTILEQIITVTGDEEKSMRMAVLERTYNLPQEELKGYTQLKEILDEKSMWRVEKYVKALSRDKNNTTKKEKKRGKKIKKVPYIDLDDDLYLGVCDEHDNYKFAHLTPDGNIELLDKVEIDGITYSPREKGKFPIGYPTFDIVHAPDLTTEELIDLLKQHIWKYVDLDEDNLEMAIFYILHTWFYKKSNTVAYLRFLGDTGKGKSRMLRVIGDLSFYPLKVGGNASRSAIMRVQELYHGTLLLDESDFRGDKENELTKYINSGFEKGSKILLANKNNPSQIQTFDPFSPKLFAMRHPFGDSATEGRLLSIKPFETYRSDIPSVLPLNYGEEVLQLRNIIAKWTLKNWKKVKVENREFIQNLPIEPRLKQMATPLSILLPLFSGEEIKDKFVEWLLRRQEQIIEDRKNTPEGIIFNTIVDLLEGDTEDLPEKYKDYLYDPNLDGDDYLYTPEDVGKPLVITTGMLKEKLGKFTKKEKLILKELGFEMVRKRLSIKEKTKRPTVIILTSPQRWFEDWRRYRDFSSSKDIPWPIKDDKINYDLNQGIWTGWTKWTRSMLTQSNNQKKRPISLKEFLSYSSGVCNNPVHPVQSVHEDEQSHLEVTPSSMLMKIIKVPEEMEGMRIADIYGNIPPLQLGSILIVSEKLAKVLQKKGIATYLDDT